MSKETHKLYTAVIIQTQRNNATKIAITCIMFSFNLCNSVSVTSVMKYTYVTELQSATYFSKMTSFNITMVSNEIIVQSSNN